MKLLLQRFIEFPSVSGKEADFVRYVADWATAQGFITDLWYPTESDVVPFAPTSLPRHIPFACRPTLVIKLPGRGDGRSLIFNAHSDVVAAPKPEQWLAGPWSGAEIDGAIHGRGACDVKGPLVAALWSMLTLRDNHPNGLAGDVLLELVPGEEDCVGLGTLTSVARGYRADAAVVLEPTENLPRCASRAGCRFEITTTGRAVHGTVKWLGIDAIQRMQFLLQALSRLETRWNDRHADPLFTPYPIARPMTVDTIAGGEWQGMVCDRCTCAGYLELLPTDDIDCSKHRFIQELNEERARLGDSGPPVDVRFGEEYQGHSTPPTDAACITAEQSHTRNGATWPGWSAFNSGCEAGVRAAVHHTPTLVWGPGTLAKAHAVDESIDFRDIVAVADAFADFATRWSNTVKGNS